MLRIGSAALNDYEFVRRPRDRDFISTIEEYEHIIGNRRQSGYLVAAYPYSSSKMVERYRVPGFGPCIAEYSIAWDGTSDSDILEYCGRGAHTAPLDVLYMLKMSHRYKKNSPHFLKTMKDIQLMRKLGAKLEKGTTLYQIYKKREKETYTYAHPKLKQAKDSFFVKDESFYVWDHDDIHRAVATFHKPAYLYFKPDDSEVMVDKGMWDSCHEEIKLAAGLEESYVLAIERSLVPHPGVLTPKQAFTKALEKVCTSITSGWFREYCWENYDKIMDLYSPDYYNRFLLAVSKGQIKEFR